MAIWPPPRLYAAASGGAPGLPRLPDHLLDGLVSVASDGHDLVELTLMGLPVLAGVGLERIRQQAAARRGRVPTDPRGRVRWAG